MIALAIIAGLVVALIPALVRLLIGPTLYDRALAAHAIVLKAVLLIAAVAVLRGDAALADAGFALVFAAFVASAAMMKFFRLRTFQPPLVRAGERDA